MQHMRALLLILPLVLTSCANDQTKYTVTSHEPMVSGSRAAQQLLAFDDSFAHDPQPRDRPVKLVAATMPSYPQELVNAGVEGLVMLRFLVNEAGGVEQVAVSRSSHPALSAAAASAVSKWRFQPITLRGQPVRQWLGFGYVFRVE